MKPTQVASCLAGVTFVGTAALLGCAHLRNYAVPGPGPSNFPTPTPTPGPTSTPSSCATQAPTATVIIVISSGITAKTVAPYGTINGYVRLNPDSTFGNVAAVITARTTDIVQFVNGENTGPTTILHSAAGFSGSSFPPVPYSFPAAVQAQVGNAITSSGAWSTGRLDPICYSQPFTAAAGTYYFGDLDYYDLTNMRDVIVVSP